MVACINESVKLGEEKTVEIDESLFRKMKYGRGKRVKGNWVFGGEQKMFLLCGGQQNESGIWLNPRRAHFLAMCQGRNRVFQHGVRHKQERKTRFSKRRKEKKIVEKMWFLKRTT
ncbi:hypothetical protein TNCV_2057441 [Trichonephila clavipes]|nr:hypothetical protein TNCV_2057441 [Trichonephila clavipes]